LFYRHYILQQREDKLESYLIDGKVIHCLLLDNGSFDQDFILMPSTVPTGNTRFIVDRIYENVREAPGLLENYSVEILDLLREINLHQKLKTDTQRLEKIITEDTKNYFEFLKIRGSKTLVDDETLKRCNEAVAILRMNNQVEYLLGLLKNEMDNVDIHNEMFLTAETDKPFGLKGIVDNVKIDHDKKIIYINDLKTTGKTISDFKETVEFYNYWAQAAIYERLIRYRFSELLTNDWQVIFTFVVIDKYNQVYPFEVTPKTMLDWQIKLELNLAEAIWHYENRDYVLPYQFATGKVTL
jgi:hypothetical protein